MTLLRVATDVGGTFTDLVAFETGAEGIRITTAKSDTTPPDFETGVLNVLEKAGIAPGDVDFMAHGTTVVINALTERKGVTVGLITTEGFRDTLEIARGNRPDFFNLHYEKPAPFVPRYLRAEVPGARIEVDGPPLGRPGVTTRHVLHHEADRDNEARDKSTAGFVVAAQEDVKAHKRNDWHHHARQHDHHHRVHVASQRFVRRAIEKPRADWSIEQGFGQCIDQ